MISIKHSGNFNHTETFLKNPIKGIYLRALQKYGAEGVMALSNATPIDSGRTASSWGYEIAYTGLAYRITWTNSNIVDGAQIALIIQYGHGTKNGSYIQGRDYINPALAPIFTKIMYDVWKEVTK